MPPRLRMGRLEDPSSIIALSNAVREWEPRLELFADRDNTMIFEAEATLYAVGIGREATLQARHRNYPLSRGDAIVVPGGVCVDAVPSADLVGVRHDGAPPNHFRERFIQTWGFELRPMPPGTEARGDFPVIPEDDPRYRISYRLSAIREVNPLRDASGLDLHLLIPLEGRGTLRVSSTSGPRRLEAGDLALVADGMEYRVEGELRLARLKLPSEAAYDGARSLAAHDPSANWSPEYHGSE